MTENTINKIVSSAVIIGMAFSVAACSKEDDKRPETSLTTSSTSTTMITIETVPETTLFVFREPIEENDQEVTWQETELQSELPKYVKINSDYLRVRKGPGTEYDQVAALTKNMLVIVVAKTQNNWYKLDSGYYVSGEYLSDTKI